MEKRLLVTVAEAAVILGISRAHLYGLLMRGEIPSIKIGRARRIPVTAIDEWIAKQVAEAAEEAQSDLSQVRPARARPSSPTTPPTTSLKAPNSSA